MRLPTWLLAASLPLAACSTTESIAPAPFPIEVGGGFAASIEGDRLVLASGDGRTLLDGLPPAAVASGAPPLTGFAVADVTTTYEMQFGTFMPTVTFNGPWRVAEQLAAAPDGSLSILDGAGALLASIQWSAPEPGHLVADITPGAGPEHHFSWGFACDDGDHFSGFGEQMMDTDHRGFSVPTWVEEHGIGKLLTDVYPPLWFIQGTRHASELPIPQYLSRRGYILTTETDLRSVFALCSESPTAARVEVDLPVRIHVFDGPTPAQAIDRATATFGRPRLPPKVAFAPWLDAIFGDTNVRDVARKLRAASIPTSVIWTEDWRGGTWDGDDYELNEEWQVDPTLYPDLKGTAAELHGEGFDFFVYFNSFVYEDSLAWPETAPNGWLVQHTDGTPYTFIGAKGTATGMLDVDNPAARAWAVGKMQAAIALGADGWMNDFGEWLPTDGVTAAGPSLLRHNTYPVALAGDGAGGHRRDERRSPADVLRPVRMVRERALDGRDVARRPAHRLRDGRRVAHRPAHGHRPRDRRDLHLRIGHRRLPVGDQPGLHQGAVLPLDRGRRLVPGDADPPRHPAAPGVELAIGRRDDGALRPLRAAAHGAGALSPGALRGRQCERAADVAGADARVSRGPDRVGDPRRGAPGRRHPGGAGDDPGRGQPSRVPAHGDAGTRGPAGRRCRGRRIVSAAAAVTEIPVFAAAGTVVPTYPDGVMTLVHGSAAVPDASSVGDDRVVYAFLGADGAFTEAGGLTYQIARQGQATGLLAMAWNGQPLPVCDGAATAPCCSATADGGTAYVTGPGSLAVSSGGAVVATLTAAGGDAGRSLTWVVRR